MLLKTVGTCSLLHHYLLLLFFKVYQSLLCLCSVISEKVFWCQLYTAFFFPWPLWWATVRQVRSLLVPEWSFKITFFTNFVFPVSCMCCLFMRIKLWLANTHSIRLSAVTAQLKTELELLCLFATNQHLQQHQQRNPICCGHHPSAFLSLSLHWMQSIWALFRDVHCPTQLQYPFSVHPLFAVNENVSQSIYSRNCPIPFVSHSCDTFWVSEWGTIFYITFQDDNSFVRSFLSFLSIFFQLTYL